RPLAVTAHDERRLFVEQVVDARIDLQALARIELELEIAVGKGRDLDVARTVFRYDLAHVFQAIMQRERPDCIVGVERELVLEPGTELLAGVNVRTAEFVRNRTASERRLLLLELVVIVKVEIDPFVIVEKVRVESVKRLNVETGDLIGRGVDEDLIDLRNKAVGIPVNEAA